MEFINLPEHPCVLEMIMMQIYWKYKPFYNYQIAKKYIYVLVLEITVIESFICCIISSMSMFKSFNTVSHSSSDYGKFSKL